MELRKIVAIIRGSALEQVEERLKEQGVEGITVSWIKGYGEYANLFKADWKVGNVKIEMFVQSEDVDSLVEAILDAAHTGAPGDGFVAVLPVEKLYRIRTRTEVGAHEL